MTKRRFISAVLTALIVAVSVCTGIAATDIPTKPDNLYVYDGADVLSDESEKHIIVQNRKLSYSTGAEIVIAAVNDIGDYNLRDYASKLFNDWEVGDPKQNNGVLILLVIGMDDFYIVQGSGIEDKITSDDIVSLRDNYLEPAFAQKDYDKGVVDLFDKLTVKYEDIYDIKLKDVSVPNGALEAKTGGELVSSILIALVIVIGIIGFIFVVVVIYNKIADSRYSGRRPTIALKPRAARPSPRANGHPGTPRQSQNSRRSSPPRGSNPRSSNPPRGRSNIPPSQRPNSRGR